MAFSSHSVCIFSVIVFARLRLLAFFSLFVLHCIPILFGKKSFPRVTNLSISLSLWAFIHTFKNSYINIIDQREHVNLP